MDKYITVGVIVLIIILLIIGFIIYRKIKCKIREISQMAFGTDSFIQGYKNRETELSNTPRSVNGMTNILLPSIIKDFPEFRYEEVKSKSEAFIKSYLNSIEKQNVDELKIKQISSSVIEKTQAIINDMISQDKKVFYDDIVIYKTEISNYQKKNGLCTVNFQSAVGFVNYCLDKDGKTVNGRKDLKRQTLFETSYTYIQDINKIQESGNYSSISLSCPHCGAPVKNLGSKFCEYCGSGVKEINIYSWNFTDIREIDKTTKRIF